jgi:hypothetical protein
MSVKHTAKEVNEEIKKAVVNMKTFYRQPFLNWSGNTLDNEEPYSEVIAKYLLGHSNLWGKIDMITRYPSSYKTESHIGIKVEDTKTNREEEWIAKSMYKNHYDGIGNVIDYQTPLNNKKSDKAGKIDLLSVPNSSTLYLIELKRGSNKETLLRCVLEIYTYSKIVDGKKLLRDFGLNENIAIKPIVAIFKNSEQYKQLNLPNVLELTKELGVEIVALTTDLKVKPIKLTEKLP